METLKSSRFWITALILIVAGVLAALGKVDGQAVIGLIGGILLRPMVKSVPDVKDSGAGQGKPTTPGKDGSN